MASNKASFWNERYANDGYTYGTQPNAFVRAEAHRLPAAADVLELGAGEGRNTVWLARQGHAVTALDAAETGLRKAVRLAQQHEVSITTVHADVLSWQPARRWDAVVATFLHLPAPARPELYGLMQEVLHPGGVVIAEWFRPDQITRGLRSGGPPSLDLMITAEELRAHFLPRGIELLEEADVVLAEGKHHRGEAAVVRMVWRKPAA